MRCALRSRHSGRRGSGCRSAQEDRLVERHGAALVRGAAVYRRGGATGVVVKVGLLGEGSEELLRHGLEQVLVVVPEFMHLPAPVVRASACDVSQTSS